MITIEFKYNMRGRSCRACIKIFLKSIARSARTLYIEISIGYISPYTIEKNYLIAIQKRNLLLREKMGKSTNLRQEVPNECR
jgi:hypothetical protein